MTPWKDHTEPYLPTGDRAVNRFSLGIDFPVDSGQLTTLAGSRAARNEVVLLCRPVGFTRRSALPGRAPIFIARITSEWHVAIPKTKPGLRTLTHPRTFGFSPYCDYCE